MPYQRARLRKSLVYASLPCCKLRTALPNLPTHNLGDTALSCKLQAALPSLATHNSAGSQLGLQGFCLHGTLARFCWRLPGTLAHFLLALARDICPFLLPWRSALIFVYTNVPTVTLLLCPLQGCLQIKAKLHYFIANQPPPPPPHTNFGGAGGWLGFRDMRGVLHPYGL